MPFSNLRLAPEAKKLACVGRSSYVDIHALIHRFLDPVTHNPGDGSQWVFFIERNGSLCCWGFPKKMGLILDEEAGDITRIVLADGILYVFASDKPVRCYRYLPASRRWETCDFSLHGLCSIVRRDLSVESATIPAIPLKGSYDSRTHTVATTDAASIGAALRDAYRRIADSAAADHRYVQPVMARYKLVGHDGNLLYTSAPVLVAPADGLQMTSAQMQIPSPGYSQASAMTLSASTFGLECVKADPDSEIWSNLVDRVEIEVAPQLHPLDPSVGTSICRYLGVTDQNLRYRCNVPGFGDAVQPGAPGGCGAGYVDAVLAFGPELYRPYALPLGTMADDIAVMQRMASRLTTLTPVEEPLAMLSSPNTFTPAAATAGGSAILYAGLTATPFEGYHPAEYAIGLADLPAGTEAFSETDLGPDGTAVMRGRIEGHMPVSLSPLIAYPSPRARAVGLYTSVWHSSFPLSRSRCGRWSFFLDPSLRPIEPEGSRTPPEFPPPSEPSPTSWPSLVAVAPASAPLSISAVGRSPVGPPVAVTPAARSGTTWEFARESFYLFGPGGSAGLAADRALATLSTARIDPRPVLSPDAVASIPGGIAVIAGGDAVRLAGSRASTILAGVGGEMLGYEPVHRELWCARASPDGTPAVRVVDVEGGWSYLREDFAPVSFCATASGLLASDADGKLRDCSAETDAPMRISFCLGAEVDVRAPARVPFSLRMAGQSLAGTVAVTASQGGGESVPVATFNLDGDVDHPIEALLPLPHCHRIHVAADLTTPKPNSFSLYLDS